MRFVRRPIKGPIDDAPGLRQKAIPLTGPSERPGNPSVFSEDRRLPIVGVLALLRAGQSKDSDSDCLSGFDTSVDGHARALTVNRSPASTRAGRLHDGLSVLLCGKVP
jgi:hypothetical protein